HKDPIGNTGLASLLRKAAVHGAKEPEREYPECQSSPHVQHPAPMESARFDNHVPLIPTTRRAGDQIDPHVQLPSEILVRPGGRSEMAAPEEGVRRSLASAAQLVLV